MNKNKAIALSTSLFLNGLLELSVAHAATEPSLRVGQDKEEEISLMTPTPPTPEITTAGITENAGVGGTAAYARAGVLEFGGALGATIAKQFASVNFSPSIGWFFMDNLQVSAIVSMQYARTEVPGIPATGTLYAVGLVEPSVHIPFHPILYGFAGVGVGISHAEGSGAGFALAPRVGLNILVGRSGIFTPALNYVYSANGAVQTSQGSFLAVNTAFGVNFGYTVMW